VRRLPVGTALPDYHDHNYHHDDYDYHDYDYHDNDHHNDDDQYHHDVTLQGVLQGRVLREHRDLPVLRELHLGRRQSPVDGELRRRVLRSERCLLRDDLRVRPERSGLLRG
jgi:hypothetical protein